MVVVTNGMHQEHCRLARKVASVEQFSQLAAPAMAAVSAILAVLMIGLAMAIVVDMFSST